MKVWLKTLVALPVGTPSSGMRALYSLSSV
jgi:hypothetical protein